MDDYHLSIYQGYINQNTFSHLQLKELELGLEEGIETQYYAFPELSPEQMRELRLGLLDGVDVTPLAGASWYTPEQIKELRLGLKNHVETAYYDDVTYPHELMRMIRLGLEDGLNVSLYADPIFTISQASLIYEGLKSGLDVSYYAFPTFEPEQMLVIKKGLENGIDPAPYADDRFSFMQMTQIKQGLEEGLDVSVYAKLCYNEKQMWQIKAGMMSKLDYTLYADAKFNENQMQEIRLGLVSGIDVSLFCDPQFTYEEMRQIRIIFIRHKKPSPKGMIHTQRSLFKNGTGIQDKETVFNNLQKHESEKEVPRKTMENETIQKNTQNGASSFTEQSTRHNRDVQNNRDMNISQNNASNQSPVHSSSMNSIEAVRNENINPDTHYEQNVSELYDEISPEQIEKPSYQDAFEKPASFNPNDEAANRKEYNHDTPGDFGTLKKNAPHRNMRKLTIKRSHPGANPFINKADIRQGDSEMKPYVNNSFSPDDMNYHSDTSADEYGFNEDLSMSQFNQDDDETENMIPSQMEMESESASHEERSSFMYETKRDSKHFVHTERMDERSEEMEKKEEEPSFRSEQLRKRFEQQHREGPDKNNASGMSVNTKQQTPPPAAIPSQNVPNKKMNPFERMRSTVLSPSPNQTSSE